MNLVSMIHTKLSEQEWTYLIALYTIGQQKIGGNTSNSG